VEAFVLDDKALSSTLIGMSFMSKLQSYRVKGQQAGTGELDRQTPDRRAGSHFTCPAEAV
jgi:hypothetical protein